MIYGLGIFKNLVDALNFEQEDIEGVAYDYDILRREFGSTITELLGLFASIKRDGSRESLMAIFAVLDNIDNLQRFKKQLSHLRRLYETLMPDAFVFEHIKDYEWLISINIAFNRFVHRSDPDLSSYEAKNKGAYYGKTDH